MKTNNLTKTLAVALVALSIPAAMLAENRTVRRSDRTSGERMTEENMNVLKNEIGDMAALFERLDSNGDGKLSPVEFARMKSMEDSSRTTEPANARSAPGKRH